MTLKIKAVRALPDSIAFFGRRQKLFLVGLEIHDGGVAAANQHAHAFP